MHCETIAMSRHSRITGYRAAVAATALVLTLLVAGCGNRYASEKTSQTFYYPPMWTMPSFSEQTQRLAAALPGLTLPTQPPAMAVPEGFDGLAIIPKVSALGRLFNVQDPYGAGYSEVVQHILDIMAQQGLFDNRWNVAVDPQHLRIESRTEAILKTLEAKDTSDCLVLPVSLGNVYAGYSVRNARETALRAHQLPLCTAQLASLLLVTPKRFVAEDSLWVHAPGDEYNDKSEGDWASAPSFDWERGHIELRALPADRVLGGYSSAVAYLGPPEG
jgi:hypothetical protein